MYDFDKIINRKGTDCIKWDILPMIAGEDNDILPMWIADMDFQTYPGVTEAIIKKAQEGVFGYSSSIKHILNPLIAKSYQKRGYRVEEDDVLVCTGVIYALKHVVMNFTNPGDKILVLSPYYPPHKAVVVGSGREMVNSTMVEKDGRFYADMEDIKAKLATGVKMFILCHPHNPTGKIFTPEELKELSDMCQENGTLIVSDEIHSDFNMNGTFVPACTASDYIYENGITVTSFTKTFSLSGLKVAYCFIHNAEMRAKYEEAQGATGLDSINCLGLEAAKAALSDEADVWVSELVEYLKENCRIAHEEINKMKNARCLENEGTYLIWIDLTKTGIPADKLNEVMIKEAKVMFNDGTTFNQPGYVRLNTACPRSLLMEGLTRLGNYLNSL